jgi:heme a synthase
VPLTERRIDARTYRRITLVALVLLGVITLTGAAVRLTGSGLGCTDWPTCYENQFHAELESHALIEFVNRLFTGVVAAGVIAAVLGSLVLRRRRRALTWWSLSLVVGVLLNALIGAVVVLTELTPASVAAHFVASMISIACATALWELADDAPRVPDRPVAPTLRALAWVVFVATGIAVFTGTIVTGAGPHAGDERVERYAIALTTAARIHGVAVMIAIALVLALVARLRRDRAPQSLRIAVQRLLVVLVAQAGVGYAQYFTGVPVVLVAIHVVGATLVVVFVTRLVLAARQRVVAAPERVLVDA